jgi:hypothetical protein
VAGELEAECSGRAPHSNQTIPNERTRAPRQAVVASASQSGRVVHPGAQMLAFDVRKVSVPSPERSRPIIEGEASHRREYVRRLYC